VTEVVLAGDFWKAEAEHQDYLQRNPRLVAKDHSLAEASV
jgi:peptide methionine sulfoxide reductase MsrA